MPDTEPVDAGERYYRETTTRFALIRLVIEVREDGIFLRFAPLQRSFRHISFEDIESARATTYDPSTYGGWHWGVRRTLGGNRVYRLRGDRGVELVLSAGGRVFVGSERSAELEAAIGRAMDAE